jgi:hypothetical protein
LYRISISILLALAIIIAVVIERKVLHIKRSDASIGLVMMTSGRGGQGIHGIDRDIPSAAASLKGRD